MVNKTALLSLSAAVAAALSVTMAPGTVQACGDGAYLAQICTVANRFCPVNTLEANGQLLPIVDNEALYSLIGCQFGGDCRTNFALPDLRGRETVHHGKGVGLTERVFAVPFGQEQIKQTEAMLNPHFHTATYATGGGGEYVDVSVAVGTSAGDVSTPAPDSTVHLAGLSGKIGPTGLAMNGPYSTAPSANIATLGGVSGTVGPTVGVDPTGMGQAMPTVMPSLALRFCIVTKGVYPDRP